MNNQFYSKSKVKNENIIFCTFDTETVGLGGNLLCTTYANPIDSEGAILIGENSMVEWFNTVFLNLPYPCIHYAHFAQYDWRYLIPYLLTKIEDYHIEFNLRTETDIYQITIKVNEKKYIMRDSFAIYPSKLKDFAERFSPSKQKEFIDFDKVDFNPENPDHVHYAIRDAVTLRESLINYNQAIEKLYGVSLGHTLAGTSVKAWQQTLNDNEIINYSKDDDIEKFVRTGYYGGLVFLTSDKPFYDCRTYDFNSSYPYVMQTYPMPIGSATLVSDYEKDTLGIYDVELNSHNVKIPIIPSRDSHGSMIWREGKIRTTITNVELEFAVSHGYTLEHVHFGYIWRSTISPFHNFVEICKGIRKRNKGHSFEIVAKLIQNSLYGKYGSKRERQSVVIGYENLEENSQAVLLNTDYEDVYVTSKYSDKMACKPEWAVFITAYARLRLLAVAYAVGVDSVLYGDTDSLVLNDSADFSKLDVGSEYGQFKLEKEWKCFRAIAPKTYAGQLTSGKWTGAGKGLKKSKMTQREYERMFNGGNVEIEYQTIPSLIVALRQGVQPAHKAVRSVSKIVNSRNYYRQGDDVRLKSSCG